MISSFFYFMLISFGLFMLPSRWKIWIACFLTFYLIDPDFKKTHQIIIERINIGFEAKIK
jgi:hypothetical protein